MKTREDILNEIERLEERLNKKESFLNMLNNEKIKPSEIDSLKNQCELLDRAISNLSGKVNALKWVLGE